MGDFNMIPLSLPHRIITSLSPIRDTWRVLHPDSSIGAANQPQEQARNRPVPTAQFNLTVNGAASDTVYNTWRWSKQNQTKLKTHPCPVDPNAEDPHGKRIDYIFASTGDVSSGSGWVVQSAAVEMTGRHPELNCSLSDHFGVRVTLQRHALPSSTSSSEPTAFDRQLRYNRMHTSTLTLADYDEMLAMTHKYMAREKSQRYWRGVRFYIAVFLWLGCLVAVWFSPRTVVSFLLVLLASVGLTAGVIDGLLALLFFSREIRGLKEFQWEIENARAAAALSKRKS
ncbi:hypothetical protein E4U40_006821 [Claviceps sp. LM458 group G5]|nr:hypothetical protein E4U40_006821 [Claviceps sp. LM458 group G5]